MGPVDHALVFARRSVARARCRIDEPTASDCQADLTSVLETGTDVHVPALTLRWTPTDERPLVSEADHDTRIGTVDPSVLPAISLVHGATRVGGMPSATTRVTFVVLVRPSPTPVIVRGNEPV